MATQRHGRAAQPRVVWARRARPRAPTHDATWHVKAPRT
ncbi:hypothetical protein DB30_07293 [Enhygromyxa salina]|uniref:Uncharacterized protein n=1 Tax=Enhygromyxa salina TaxID=215803 RepID=A0A0C2CS64_9BACT|nr:hypothetical protein DB30_07293 [Enhygromyxa salina]